MKNRAIITFFAILLGMVFSYTGFAKSIKSPTKISEIEKWIGKYPFDEIGGIEIFQMKSFRSHLLKILGKTKFNELDRIKNRGPHTPVESDHEIIHFSVCQKHKCGHTFFFLMKAKSEQLFICESDLDLNLEPGAADVSQSEWRITWYGEKGKVTLPNSYCEFFDEKNQEFDWEKAFVLIPAQLK